ncbi:MAG: hypothetical protein ACPL0A_00250 [Candidatus Micrarchaeia archaeon]
MDVYSYPKPLRIPIGKRIGHKKYMSEDSVRRLFEGNVVVEEKMDGKQSFIETRDYVLWVEDLRFKHSLLYHIPCRYALFDVYEKRTGRFLSPESKLGLWLDKIRKHKIDIPENVHIFPVPVVKKLYGPDFGKDIDGWERSIPSLITTSFYAVGKDNTNAFMEGIVIKQDRSLYSFEVEHAKLVREEFVEGITRNYLEKPYELNKIDLNVPVLLSYETWERISLY